MSAEKTTENGHGAAVQPSSFKFSKENLSKIKDIIKKYPEGRQQSAVMPLLDLAQRQHENWIPVAAMDEIAQILDMPKTRVYEVASFYTMYNKQPVGKLNVQVCATTPCMLCGSDELIEAVKEKYKIGLGETSADGMVTLSKVECLGACSNAPMVQINDDYYEDLDKKSFMAVLSKLSKGEKVATGSQIGRTGACPKTGPTSLKSLVAQKSKAAKESPKEIKVTKSVKKGEKNA